MLGMGDNACWVVLWWSEQYHSECLVGAGTFRAVGDLVYGMARMVRPT